MSPSRFHLKQPAGWFAAGRQLHQALTLLSDATFKLFVWLCLHAERSTGSLCVQPEQLATALAKTEAEIQAGLVELACKGVVSWSGDGALEIRDRFWPYERACRHGIADRAAYIAEVKRLFLQRSCVQGAFTSADERFATQLHQKGFSLEWVERAILLGSLRKYAALLNHRGGTPVTSLHYYAALFDEVQQLQVGADYWRYVASKVRALEHQWRQLQPTQQPEPTPSGDEMMETK